MQIVIYHVLLMRTYKHFPIFGGTERNKYVWVSPENVFSVSL